MDDSIYKLKMYLIYLKYNFDKQKYIILHYIIILNSVCYKVVYIV